MGVAGVYACDATRAPPSQILGPKFFNISGLHRRSSDYSDSESMIFGQRSRVLCFEKWVCGSVNAYRPFKFLILDE